MKLSALLLVLFPPSHVSSWHGACSTYCSEGSQVAFLIVWHLNQRYKFCTFQCVCGVHIWTRLFMYSRLCSLIWVILRHYERVALLVSSKFTSHTRGQWNGVFHSKEHSSLPQICFSFAYIMPQAHNSPVLILKLHTGWHKKTGTFEKPNKNWRNPRKKIYWQKLNHYNLPFKRQ